MPITSANSLSLSVGGNSDLQSNARQVRKFLQFQLGKTQKAHRTGIQGDIALLDAEVVTEVIAIAPQDILPSASNVLLCPRHLQLAQ